MHYEKIARRLAETELDAGPAELYGVLCGLLCAHAKDPTRQWEEEFLGDTLAQANLEVCREVMTGLKKAAEGGLDDPEMGFQLLTPDDERPATERGAALAEWCEGFLYGFGIAGGTEHRLSEDARLALTDIGEISRLDATSLSDAEEDENALMEIEEFLRVSAMMLFEETRRPGRH